MALGGAVATVVIILVTLAEFSYIPTTWYNTSHLTRRLLFLVTLALTTGPTFDVAIVENPRRRRIPRPHPWHCPVFHFCCCHPPLRNYALRSDVWRSGCKSRKSRVHGLAHHVHAIGAKAAP